MFIKKINAAKSTRGEELSSAEICSGLHTIICMQTSISITECPLAHLVNFTFTCGEKYTTCEKS